MHRLPLAIRLTLASAVALLGCGRDSTAPERPSLTGVWEGSRQLLCPPGPAVRDTPLRLSLTQTGDTLTGTYQDVGCDGSLDAPRGVTGSVADARVELVHRVSLLSRQVLSAQYVAARAGATDSLRGRIAAYQVGRDTPLVDLPFAVGRTP